jgi:hypothetical protein
MRIDWWRNRGSEISWHCPFNVSLFFLINQNLGMQSATHTIHCTCTLYSKCYAICKRHITVLQQFTPVLRSRIKIMLQLGFRLRLRLILLSFGLCNAQLNIDTIRCGSGSSTLVSMNRIFYPMIRPWQSIDLTTVFVYKLLFEYV